LLRDRSVRRSTGTFAIEGPVLVADALAFGIGVREVYAEPDALTDELAAALGADGIEPVLVRSGGLERVLDTVTPQPVVAVATLPSYGLHDAVTDLTVVLVGVADPGNAGTLIRTAEAAGAGAVLCCGATADPFAPKAVRAAAGSTFRLPVVVEPDPVRALTWLGSGGLARVGLVAASADIYDAVDLTGPVAIVLGNEAHGLPDAAMACLDRVVSIPMAGDTESLNVAAAGAIVCFEAARQRRAR
jgi:TrmH family RNA methyltransferase